MREELGELLDGHVTGPAIGDETELKMWVIIRKDLPISLGKLIAQTGHAYVTAYELTRRSNPERASHWFENGQPKLSKRAKNEGHMLRTYRECKQAGLVAVIIEDAGRTELPPDTLTAVAVGPCLFGELPVFVQKLQLVTESPER